MDFELFSNNMRAARGWAPHKAKEVWLALEKDLAIGRDEKGFGQFKLRLVIPPHITGEDFDESRAGRYEDRALETSTKATKMTEEDKATWLAETTRGFSSTSTELRKHFHMAALTPTPVQSCASEVNEAEISADVLSKAAAAAAEAAAEATDSVQTEDEPAEQGKAEPSPRKKINAGTFTSERNKLWGGIRDTSTQLKSKLVDEIKTAALALHASDPSKHGTIFIDVVRERCTLAKLTLGVEARVSMPPAPPVSSANVAVVVVPRVEVSLINWKSELAPSNTKVELQLTEEDPFRAPQEDTAAAVTADVVETKGGVDGQSDSLPAQKQGSSVDKVGLVAVGVVELKILPDAEGDSQDSEAKHAAALANFIRTIDILPIESPEILCWSSFTKFHQSIASISSDEALMEASSKWDTQNHLMTQLHSGLKQATKELNSELGSASRREKKEEEKKQEREWKRRRLRRSGPERSSGRGFSTRRTPSSSVSPCRITQQAPPILMMPSAANHRRLTTRSHGASSTQPLSRHCPALASTTRCCVGLLPFPKSHCTKSMASSLPP